MTDLIEWLDAARRDATALRAWLERSSRPLADGWWHAHDLDEAYGFAERRLAELALEPPSQEAFAARHEMVCCVVDDEEERRRHQLGFVATHANARLSDGRRFHCLGRAAQWELHEPAWALLSDDEHRRALVLAGPPSSLEEAYSGRTELPEVRLYPTSYEDLRPHDARMKADAAIREGRYLDALPFLPRASEDGDHGLLARLTHIDTLRRLQRGDEARALWSETADDWLSGKRRVWDTQWKALLKLHDKLRVPADDSRLAGVREKAHGR